MSTLSSNMCRFVISTFVLLFYSIFLKAAQSGEFQKLYAISVRCNGSEKFINQNYSCFAKSYSRNFSTINIVGTTTMPLSNIFAVGKLLFRYGQVYREVLWTPKFNVCSVIHKVLGKYDLGDKMIAAGAKFFTDTYPEMIHECPYNGLNVRNFSGNATRSLFTIFPTGEYKIIVNGWIGTENLGKLTIVGTVTSSNRDTFG